MNNKLVFTLGAIIVIGIGIFLLQGDTINYAATIDDEVAALEAELADIEAAVAAGELTPEEAAEAQIGIVNRLSTINTAVESSGRASLTPSQRTQLLNGLDRLKNILTVYQGTLSAVDDAVLELPESERPRLNPRGSRSGGGNRTIADAIAEIVDVVEDHVEDVVEEYVPEETATTTEEMEDDMETATTTGDSATTTEDDMETGTSTEEMSDTENTMGTTTEDESVSQ